MSKVFVTSAFILLGVLAMVAPSCIPATQSPSTGASGLTPDSAREPSPAITPTPTSTVTSKLVTTVNTKELRQKLEGGHSPVILDVRHKTDFDTSHIDRALSMPLQEIPNLYQELPQGTEVIVYAQCS